MQFQALRWNGSDPDRPLFPNRVRKADRLQTTRVGRWRSLARCQLAAIHSCSHFDSNGHPRTSRFDGGSRDSVVRSGSAETAPIDPVADVATDLHDGFINAGPQMMNTETLSRLLRTDIGRAHVCTPVPNAHHVCRLLLEKKTYTHDAR